MDVKKTVILLVFAAAVANAQQKDIQLYPGITPGSESWTWKEGINNKNSFNVMTVYNVVHPSLTVFAPDATVANGTAIIIAPGGGFHFLAIDHEGNNAANWLTRKGITVFVLKYRLVHILNDNPFDEMLNTKDQKAWDKEGDAIIPLAVSDGRAALAYVRTHAAEYKINPGRIGIMGFSAGGRVAASTAFGYSNVNRPDFVAPIYADIPESIQGTVLPDAPSLFLACAEDDEFGFVTHAISLYNKWYAIRRPAEMHLFAKGGHGFGVGSPDNTTYRWLDKFSDWLVVQGLMKPQKK